MRSGLPDGERGAGSKLCIAANVSRGPAAGERHFLNTAIGKHAEYVDLSSSPPHRQRRSRRKACNRQAITSPGMRACYILVFFNVAIIADAVELKDAVFSTSCYRRSGGVGVVAS